MIHVDRKRVKRPAVLDWHDSPGAEERLRASRHFSLSERESGQRRFSFAVYRDPSVHAALFELFHGKCAYCESRISHVGSTEIAHFRPKGGVTESPGHPGYWWLAAAWENLHLGCADCNRPRWIEGTKGGRGQRFPLFDESERAFSAGQESRERPLLLDPCADQPGQHLVFDDDGLVASETERGQTTILVLNLNRPGLVDARRHAAREVRFIAESWDLRKGGIAARFSAVREALQSLTHSSQEYAGLKRQLVMPALRNLLRAEDLRNLVSSWNEPSPRITRATRERARKSFKAFEISQSEFSLSNKEGRRKFRSLRRQIEHVAIRNFRAIRTLDLDLALTRERSGWLMLLGENGTGKSSVLQAIALTLAGASYLLKLIQKGEVSLPDLLAPRIRRAKLSVKLTGFFAAHQLTIRRDRAEFRQPNGDVAIVSVDNGVPTVQSQTSHSAETQSVLLAYGATRLLPRKQSSRYGLRNARVNNLFDPFRPLLNAEDWLMGLGWRSFNSAAIVLKDLLALDENSQFVREKGRLLVRANGTRVPIRQLSDGYQAAVAMCIDVLEVSMRLWPRLQDAEGIVLLDEIGAHLHPTWKLRIVASLRNAFPGMQFIATTHDPLCLRGLSAGEVVVMQRDNERRIVAVADLPSPADFRVDQLLTSEFFGLNSTTDPEVEALFDEYYALLALEAATPKQRLRLETLREELKERRHLGGTVREQLMFEAIDTLLARNKGPDRKPLPELKRETIAQVQSVWRDEL